MSFEARVDRLLQSALFHLGRSVSYQPLTGGIFLIRAIWDESFEQVDPESGAVIASNAPRMGVRLKDLPFTPRKEDTVVREQTPYRVIDSQEDGQGGATLLLHRK
ncbi:MAG: hypothetical protein HY538_07460 [Deltaproteobacteria bacterium]|nr:hypothetical protein [Deltaproteobacteria bacterium]